MVTVKTGRPEKNRFNAGSQKTSQAIKIVKSDGKGFCKNLSLAKTLFLVLL